MNKLQIGPERTRHYYLKSFAMLHRMMARFDLGIVEMAALTALESTVMESLSPNIYLAQRTLMNGLKGLDWIMSDEVLYDQAMAALIEGLGNVRYAVVVNRPGRGKQVIAYLKRYEPYIE